MKTDDHPFLNLTFQLIFILLFFILLLWSRMKTRSRKNTWKVTNWKWISILSKWPFIYMLKTNWPFSATSFPSSFHLKKENLKTSSPEASSYWKGTHAMAMSNVAGQKKLRTSITLLINSFLKNPGILLAVSPQVKFSFEKREKQNLVFNDRGSLKSSSFTLYFIGKPIYKFRSNGKITVLVPYFSAEKELTLSNIEVFNHKLSTAIHLSLKKTQFDVNVDIRLIRVQYPYLDSAIFAQYIALNVSKYNLTQIKNLITRSYSPEAWGESQVSQLTGIKWELAGRLTTQRSIPRKTVENTAIGSFSRLSLNLSQYTSKNKIGAYTIKVWLAEAGSFPLKVFRI